MNYPFPTFMSGNTSATLPVPLHLVVERELAAATTTDRITLVLPEPHIVSITPPQRVAYVVKPTPEIWKRAARAAERADNQLRENRSAEATSLTGILDLL